MRKVKYDSADPVEAWNRAVRNGRGDLRSIDKRARALIKVLKAKLRKERR